MAEKTPKKIEEELNYSICLDTDTDPKLLQCFHAYCQKCSKKLVVRDHQGQLVLTCPTCPVPANGVADLQPAFHSLEILEPASAENEVDASSATYYKVQVCCHEHIRESHSLDQPSHQWICHVLLSLLCKG